MNVGGAISSAAGSAAGSTAASTVGSAAANTAGSTVANQAAGSTATGVVGTANPTSSTTMGGHSSTPSLENNAKSQTGGVNTSQAQNSAGGTNNTQAQSNTSDANTSQGNESSQSREEGSLENNNSSEQSNNSTSDSNNDQNNQTEEEQPKKGDKTDEAGKEVGENGEVQDSSTKKLVKGVGRGAAAYFTGGQSLKYDQAVTNNQIGDHVLGVVSDELEKNAAVKVAADALDKAGVTDSANDLMDTAGSALNGDIKGTVENAKKAKKSVNKMKWNIAKRMIIGYLIGFFVFITVVVVPLLMIMNPILGGFMDVVDNVVEVVSDAADAIVDFVTGSDGGKIDSSASVSTDSKAILNRLFPAGIPSSSSEMSKYMSTVYVEINTIDGGTRSISLTVHKDLTENVKKIFADIKSAGGIIDPSTTGCYNYRKMVDSGNLSHHSYGVACDVNWNKNPLCYNGKSCSYNTSDPLAITANGAIASSFKKNGWIWGGEWSSKKDYMHFSLTGH